MGEVFAHDRIGDMPMDRVLLNDREAGSFLLESGDLLFARQSLVLSGAGKCSIFLGAAEPATFESHLIRVRLAPDKADPKFFYYFFKSPPGRAAIVSIVEQVAAAGIRGSDLANLPVPAVDLAEQRAIAAILSALDDKIELNRRMSLTLESMARALFKSWFVDFDPVRAKAEGLSSGLPLPVDGLFPDVLDDGELGDIPAGWRVAMLSEVADLSPESWSRNTRPESIQYVDLANTKSGRIEATANYSSSDAPSRAQRVLRPGDTIVGTVRPGNRSYALVADEGLTGSTGFAVLRPKRRQCREWVYLRATADDSIDELARLADGAAYPAVRPDVVSAIQCVWPPDMVLETFHRIAHPVFDRLASAERESAGLRRLRDRLLPNLMSGDSVVRRNGRLAGGAA